MSVRRRLGSQSVLSAELCTQDVFSILFEYIDYGRIRNSNSVNLSSFDASTLRSLGLDFSGDAEEHGLYAATRYFPDSDRLICAEIKIYFHGDEYRTNGLSLVGKVRLASFLRRLVNRDRGRTYKLELFLYDDMTEGAILFDGGVVVRFNSGYKNSTRNYYIGAVESSVDESEMSDIKKANARSLSAVYRSRSIEDLENLADKYSDNLALKKLNIVFAKLEEIEISPISRLW